MILDLRSQQVRDTCHFVMKLAEVTGDRMKPFLRDSFSSILEGVKIPHKVTSGYIDECIIHLIKHVTFKSAIILVMHEVKESKSKVVRERCLDYINLILVHWDITEKEQDFFVDAIKIGLEDAAVRAREIARSAYLNMFNLYPDKAEKIKSLLPRAYQLKLTRTEEEGLSAVPGSPNTSVNLGSSIDSVGLKSLAKHLNSTGDSVSLSSTIDESSTTTSLGTSGPLKSTKANDSSSAPTPVVHSKKPITKGTPHHTMATTASATHAALTARAHHDAAVAAALHCAETIPVPAKKKAAPVGHPRAQPSSSETLSSKFDKRHYVGNVNLLASASSDTAGRSSVDSTTRQSESNRNSTESAPEQSVDIADDPLDPVEQAVLSIQARVRGTQSRRRSVVHNPFAALAASSPEPQTQSSALSSSANSAGSLSSGASTGITSHATTSTVSITAPAATSAPSSVSFASSVKDRPAATSSSASSARNPRTPAPSKRTGLRSSQDTPALPAFSTSTTTQASVLHTSSASARKTSAGSDRGRSTSAGRSPRSVNTPATSRSRSASKSRPTTAAAAAAEVTATNGSPNRISSSSANTHGSWEDSAAPADKMVLFPKDLSLSMHVFVVTAKEGRVPGTVRFIGHTAFAAGIWVGVALDGPYGKNDGSVHGRRYFDCKPEHGLFVKEEAVERVVGGVHCDRDSVSVTSQETPTPSVANSNQDSTERKGSISGLLKLKLSQMMELLNHQLQIVVELEEEEKIRGGQHGHSLRAADLHAEIVNMTNKEEGLIGTFKQHLHDRLS
eukprot:CAMPEP_0170367926 /NCGR_PEP_ID=MMETSP0117_2-20130122/7183_1 /TAXON_ID=400756 /ORGANISM="Durinskia baltica, Strain CSIRO CS-38" /LENGTH=788 /DNA_ID=CAMNT_0010622557 /DNA_START=256 /DNA_END=2622 /DNA_ORIENTATION=+